MERRDLNCYLVKSMQKTKNLNHLMWWNLFCSELNAWFSWPTRSYSLNVCVFCTKYVLKYVGLWGGYLAERVKPSWIAFVCLKKRSHGALSPFYHVKMQLRRQSSPRHAAVLISGFQPCREINCCCLYATQAVMFCYSSSNGQQRHLNLLLSKCLPGL